MKMVTIQWFAVLRDHAGAATTVWETRADRVEQVFEELHAEFRLPLPAAACRFAINDDFVEPGSPVLDGDRLAILPPVAGG